MLSLALLVLAGAWAASPSSGSTGNANSQRCPPPGFDSVADFSLKGYSAAPWYVQKQNEVSYQPKDSLFCVRAEYVPIDPNQLSKGFYVHNYANKGRVNGEPTGTIPSKGNGQFLLALPDTSATGSTASSKLLVVPAFIKRLLPFSTWRLAAGPYWVVAVGPSKNRTLAYDWAIISGGAPNTPTDNGLCRTGGSLLPQSRQYFGGLWFFSRKPVDPESTAEMQAVAEDLGLDTSKMQIVQQQGCSMSYCDLGQCVPGMPSCSKVQAVDQDCRFVAQPPE